MLPQKVFLLSPLPQHSIAFEVCSLDVCQLAMAHLHCLGLSLCPYLGNAGKRLKTLRVHLGPIGSMLAWLHEFVHVHIIRGCGTAVSTACLHEGILP